MIMRMLSTWLIIFAMQSSHSLEFKHGFSECNEDGKRSMFYYLDEEQTCARPGSAEEVLSKRTSIYSIDVVLNNIHMIIHSTGIGSRLQSSMWKRPDLGSQVRVCHSIWFNIRCWIFIYIHTHICSHMNIYSHIHIYSLLIDIYPSIALRKMTSPLLHVMLVHVGRILSEAGHFILKPLVPGVVHYQRPFTRSVSRETRWVGTGPQNPVKRGKPRGMDRCSRRGITLSILRMLWMQVVSYPNFAWRQTMFDLEHSRLTTSSRTRLIFTITGSSFSSTPARNQAREPKYLPVQTHESGKRTTSTSQRQVGTHLRGNIQPRQKRISRIISSLERSWGPLHSKERHLPTLSVFHVHMGLR